MPEAVPTSATPPQDSLPAGALRGRPCWLERWGGPVGLAILAWPWLKHEVWNTLLGPTGPLGDLLWLPSPISGAAEHEATLALFTAAALAWVVGAGELRTLRARLATLARPAQLGLLCLALLLLWNAVSALASPTFFASQLGLVRAARMTAGVFAVVLLLHTETRRQGLLRALLLGTVLLGLYCATVAAVYHDAPWGERDWAYFTPTRLIHPFAMPAALGGVAMVGALAGLGTVHDGLVRGHRAALLWGFLALAAGVGAIMLSHTLSCTVGVLGGVWMLGLLRIQRRWFARYLVASVLVATLACGGVLWYLFRTPQGRRQLYWSSGAIRVFFVESALRMGLDRPMVGWGPDAYHYGAAFHERPESVLSQKRGDWVRDAHNEPAQVFGELGAVGFLLWAGVMAAAVATCLPAARRRLTTAPPRDRLLGYGGVTLVVLAGVLADGLTNPAQRRGELGWIVAVVVAMALAAGWQRARPAPAQAPGPGRTPPWTHMVADGIVRCVVVLACAALVWDAARAYQGQLDVYRSLAWMKAGEFDQQEAAARRAAPRMSNIDLWQRAQSLVGRALNAKIHRDHERREALSPTRRAQLDRTQRERLRRGAALYRELHERIPSIEAYAIALASKEAGLGRPNQQLFALLDGLRFRPYSYGLRIRLRNALVDLPGPVMSSWHRAKALPGVPARQLAWMREQDWDFLAAMWLFEIGEGEEAVAQLARMDPASVRLMPFATEYARMLYGTGRREAAAQVLEQATARVPSDYEALYLLAAIRYEQGGEENYAQAIDLLRRARRRHKGYPEASALYARFMLATGQYDEALNAVSEARRHYRNRPIARKAMVETLLQLGKYERAVREIHDACEIIPNSEPLRRLKEQMLADPRIAPATVERALRPR